MSANSLGKLIKFSIFGESHGEAIGGIIDGFPSNIIVDYDFIKSELSRRKPKNETDTHRIEEDEVVFLSGILENTTTGAPIAFYIANKNSKNSDYESIKDTFRPSQGDYTYYQKYKHYDSRGGGHYSARLTAASVVAGAMAKLVLLKNNIEVLSCVGSIGKIISNENIEQVDYKSINNKYHFAQNSKENIIEEYLKSIKKEGDSVGGIVYCTIKNLGCGVGEPLFEKLNSRIAAAIFSINAVKGVEFGAGFGSSAMLGSEFNDQIDRNGFLSNNDGGIQAGISNGNDINFRVAFKPAPSIYKQQQTIDKEGNEKKIKILGRHDVCFLPRVLPVVESYTALIVLDYLLINNCYK